ncbi:GntR family transcriptional regulator / MocR family aminotransferase [Frankia sp. Hr75.2]|nr:GntR family transcriptional regulator / MocR family aminotransferase [Frankia sp. Hr75.2]
MLSMDVDRGSAVSMSTQIKTVVRSRVLDGTLPPGTRLPSSRSLASDLGVSRSVVVQAYEQLVGEGYLRAAQGSGTRVSSHLPVGAFPDTTAVTPYPVRFDLRAGATGAALFPGREWLIAYEGVVRSMDRGQRPAHNALGAPELRAELAGYLGRVRGVTAAPSEIAVTSGFTHALTAVCAVLREFGIDRLAVEDPGDPRHRRVVSRAGTEVIGVPVDDAGLDVAALARSGARAVLVNPVKQLPTGVALSAPRRDALVGWAEQARGWVIEFDPEGHLWFGGGSAPLVLQRRLPDRVVYAGSTRSLLGPGPLLGWLVGPPQVLDALRRGQARWLGAPDRLTQLALADLVSRGLFDQHIRRVREMYQARHDALRSAVASYLPGARTLGVEAGSHSYVALPAGVDDARLALVAGRRFVLAQTGRDFRTDRQAAEPALVVGYGAVERDHIAEAIALIGHLDERGAGRR